MIAFFFFFSLLGAADTTFYFVTANFIMVGNLLEKVVHVTLLLFVLLGFELTLLSPLD